MNSVPVGIGPSYHDWVTTVGRHHIVAWSTGHVIRSRTTGEEVFARRAVHLVIPRTTEYRVVT